MRLRAFLSLCVAGSILTLSACNTSSSGGNPGTTDSFTLKAPTITTSIKQGERQIIKVSISRGSSFKQALTFDATEPKGLKIGIDHKKISASDPAEVAITVEVEKTAPLGEQSIKVTATPETGSATSVDVKVKVDEGPK